MEKINPITADLILKGKKLNKEISDLNEMIINRIHYIISFLFETFSEKKGSWWFDGAEEGEVGDFWKNYYGYEIAFRTDIFVNDIKIIDKNGNFWSCGGWIPDRWLFEDFENEIIEGKKLLEEQNAKKKTDELQLKEQNELEKQKLITSAKSKLTKQEIKALGLE